MRLHYVDDDPTDTRVMARLFREDASISLKTSQRLKDFLDFDGGDGDPDCVFVDVMRPDSRSMEDDVVRVRKQTRAPIVFVTGSEASLLRQAAVDAGAEGVLEKNCLTKDVILQFARNAVVRACGTSARRPGPGVARKPPALRVVPKPAPAPRLDVIRSLSAITGLLSAELRLIQQGMDHDLVTPRLEDDIGRIAETANGLDAFVQSDQRCLEEVDILEVAQAARSCINKVAGKTAVAMIWQMKSALYQQVGSFAQAVEAIKHLCYGAFSILGPTGGVLLVVSDIDRESGKVRLQIYGTGLHLPAAWTKFEPDASKRRIPLQAQASLELALMLFGVSSDRLVMSQKSETAILTLHL